MKIVIWLLNSTNLFIIENGIGLDEGTAMPTDAYERLEEDEKQKVWTIVYIIGYFSISLEGYHELSQVGKFLPRTHLVETCTTLMEGQWDPRESRPQEVPKVLRYP